ncbi:MAG TPA: pyridoxal phosphate-dependent aminotransferase [Urbifossiella sp.]|nr:pyridoxal phosphate-dependent aminotransferase [Urbifossiella sp.]
MAYPLWLARFLVQTGIARFLPLARRLSDGGGRFLRYYSDAVLSAPVEELLDPAYFPTAGPDVIDLNLPAPRYESSLSVGRITADRRGHPPAGGLLELRRAIAEHSVRRGGAAIDAQSEAMVAHGAAGAFAAALDAFVNPGDRVVLFDPSSPLFALGAKSRRADLRWVPTTNDEGRCRFSLPDLEKATRGAKLIVLCNPGNPTGASLDEAGFDAIANIAIKRGALVYLDESFGLGGCAERAAPSLGKRMAELHRDGRLLAAGSVSQGWGLASLRVGWLTGHRHLIQACSLTANLHAPYVPTLCQQIATRALTEGPDLGITPTDQALDKRQFAVHRLRALGLDVEWPAAGFFAWVSVASLGMDGRTFAERLLKEKQVLVRPGCAFGPSGAYRVRISFAADDGRLREGLSRLAAFAERRHAPEPVSHRNEAMATAAAEPAFSRA